MNDNLKIIVLMGIKHCGKTTLGKRLASYFNGLFFDTDDVIFQQTGKTAREIYSESGAAAFMEAEKVACESVVKQLSSLNAEGGNSKYAIVSTGGGFCNNEGAKAVLKGKSKFIFLKTDELVAADRIAKEITVSPDGSLSGVPAYIAKENPKSVEEVRTIFHDFYEKRCALYSAMADITVLLPKASKEENTQRLIDAISE